jgi:hypothetical protein
MRSDNSILDLKNAILLLEAEQEIKGKVLQEQLTLVYESFKPVNLITGTLNDIAKSPFLIDNMIGTGIGLASGFLTKRVFVGSSGSLIRKLLGSILQFGVTNVVAQHSDNIKSIGQLLFQKLIHKKEKNPISQQ